MVGEEKPGPLRPVPDEGEPHRLRLREVEPPVPFPAGQPFDVTGDAAGDVTGEPADIALAPGRAHPVDDQLDGLARAPLAERGPQRRVAADERVGRRVQGHLIQLTLEINAELDVVDVRPGRVVPGVEEQALLEGRQREDVGHPGRRHPALPQPAQFSAT